MTIEGTYAHRFAGFAMTEGAQFYIVGLGSMKVDSKGNIVGAQTSSATALKGSAALIEVGEFDLEGNLWAVSDGLWKAKITFTLTGGNGNGPKEQVLVGTFTLVPSGSPADPTEKFWLISTGARNETDDSDADEVVSGEATRIAKNS